MQQATGTTAQGKRITVCGYCRKRVMRMRNGEWYHRHNGSAFCHPGYGTGRKAFPLEITVRP